MRGSAGLLRFLAPAALVLVAVGSTPVSAQTQCEAKRRSCIAECRARYFSIDPKRDACISDCTTEANRCERRAAAGWMEEMGVACSLSLRPAIRADLCGSPGLAASLVLVTP